jgi:hypothetical protein
MFGGAWQHERRRKLGVTARRRARRGTLATEKSRR